uniref:ATP synthase F(0) complex subunit f, mitochondrial n=1 Tax=Monodelphis domestica TaxID=13616 RepID=A0A5F8GPX0_MONDO
MAKEVGMPSNISLSVTLRDQRLLDVKLEQLPAWIMKWEFSSTRIIKSFWRGYDAYFNKYIDVKKGGIAGVSLVLAGYILLNYYAAYKEFKHE